MIQKIKRKVSIIHEQHLSKPSNKKSVAKLTEGILSELKLVEKIKEKLIDQSEQAEFSDSEDSMSDLLHENSMSTQTMTQIFADKETFIGPVYFDESVQTDYYIQVRNISKIEPTKESKLEILNLQQKGLIPEEADIESWEAGYFTGLDRGKSLGATESIEIEKKFIENQENLSDESLSEEDIAETPLNDDEGIVNEENFEIDTEKVKTEGREVRKKKFQTRIKEFNFQKREKILVQKVTKSKKIRESLMKKSLEVINKRSRMSKKMVIKMINSIYTSLLLKYKQEDTLEDLLEYIYQEFVPKYSMKKVVERKLMDFLCNLIQYSESLKVKNFLKFLDLNEKVSIKSFTNRKESLFIYISSFDFILKSKAGISSEFDEISEFYFIPLIRGIELVKDKFSEIFPSSRISKCLEYLEKHSIFDKKRLNKSGVIDLEVLLTFMMNQLEEHVENIKHQGEYIIKAITCDNSPNFIKKSDLVFLATLFKSFKYIKDIENINHELIKIDTIFSCNIREIFPEEFVNDKSQFDFEAEYQKTLEILKYSTLAEKNKYLAVFLANGVNLDPIIFLYIEKILELYAKNSLR